jgi:ABC-type methionine transport system ATPase subunit
VRGLRRLADGPAGDEILRGVDLDVPRGVVMGVIGPSGSGKSTLLRALNRLWEPAPGAVLLDGADIRGIDVLALRRKVGMLFQLPAMFEGTPKPQKLTRVDFVRESVLSRFMLHLIDATNKNIYDSGFG